MVLRSGPRGAYAKGIECREALARAALQLVAERGVAGVSVAAVAAEARVTKGAAYWHFADKAALLDAATERASEMWMAEMLAGVLGVPSAQKRLQWLVSEHVSQLLRPRSAAAYLTKLVAAGPEGRPVLRKWRSQVRQILGHAVSGTAAAPPAARGLTDAVLAALIGLGILWDTERNRMSLEAAGAEMAYTLTLKLRQEKAFSEPYPMVLI